jgi:hypothetical protein
MRRFSLACLALTLCITSGAARAAEWRVERIDTPARVTALQSDPGRLRVDAGGLWYAIGWKDGRARLTFVDAPPRIAPPAGALPDGKIATGMHDIARAWFAEPTERYDHGILGDKTEAGALIVETRDGKAHTVRLMDDAVFEDLAPRLVDLDGDGQDEVVVVKSYLKRGSALAVVGLRKKRNLWRYDMLAETPPLGAPHRWLNPAGIADFSGNGKTDIALVRQPHVVGALELWSWSDGRLRKTAEMPDTTNHIIGTRALHMSAVADFDGDGIADIALPSLDRSRLRIVSFAPSPREIANVELSDKAVTNLGLLAGEDGAPGIVVGLANGALVLVRKMP